MTDLDSLLSSMDDMALLLFARTPGAVTPGVFVLWGLVAKLDIAADS